MSWTGNWQSWTSNQGPGPGGDTPWLPGGGPGQPPPPPGGSPGGPLPPGHQPPPGATPPPQPPGGGYPPGGQWPGGPAAPGPWGPGEPSSPKPPWLLPAAVVGAFALLVAVVVAVALSSGGDDDGDTDQASGSGTTTTASTTTTTTTEPSGDVDAFAIGLGDCWNQPTRTADPTSDEPYEVQTISLIPCSEEHELEVYAVFYLEDGPYPGDQVVNDDAMGGCFERWEDFVGVPADSSELSLQALFPVQQSWEQGSDREVVCSIEDPNGLTVGSLEAAGR